MTTPPLPTLDRRRFLLLVGGALAAGCTADRLGAPDAGGPTTTTTPSAAPVGSVLPGAVDDRVLVVVDLGGGNDGLNTLAPVSTGRYHDLRPTLALAPEEVIDAGGGRGWHPALRRLSDRGLRAIQGVGPVDGDLSHFAMTDRWIRGDAAGNDDGTHTGFLGRLTDALDDGSPLVGLSVAGATPAFVNQRAGAMALADPDGLWFLAPDAWEEPQAFQAAMAEFRDLPDLGPAYGQLLDIGAELGGRAEALDGESELIRQGGGLGRQLALAALAIEAGIGTRVIHAALDGFDTHDDHRGTHDGLLDEVDAAVGLFLDRLDRQGLGDRVVVATTSEFGRRVPQNGNGLDHGAASVMLLAGAVEPGIDGDDPDLDALDDDDNLPVGIGFDRYYASLAEEWLGVEAASVLPGNPEPLGLW